jgi:hypothetical protein
MTMINRLTNEEIQQTVSLLVQQIEYIESEKKLLQESDMLINFNLAENYATAQAIIRNAIVVLDSFQGPKEDNES